MRVTHSLACVFGLLLWALSGHAVAEGYRLVEIARAQFGSYPAVDLNNRGEVVFVGDAGAFRWRNGRRIAYPDERFVGTAINDWSTVVGMRYGTVTEGGILRHRRFRPLQVNGRAVVPEDINNLGQVVVRIYNDDMERGSFLLDWRGALRLDTVPGASSAIFGTRINDRGVIVGNVGLAASEITRPAIWRDGKATLLDIPIDRSFESCRAHDINNRSQIVGMHVTSGSRAFVWSQGEFTFLPELTELPFYSSDASGINDWGAVVGSSGILVSEYSSTNTAALWFGGQVFNINELIDDHDPNKPFVTVDSALRINNRGDIVARGHDSRVPDVAVYYMLTLFRWHAH